MVSMNTGIFSVLLYIVCLCSTASSQAFPFKFTYSPENGKTFFIEKKPEFSGSVGNYRLSYRPITYLNGRAQYGNYEQLTTRIHDNMRYTFPKNHGFCAEYEFKAEPSSTSSGGYTRNTIVRIPEPRLSPSQLNWGGKVQLGAAGIRTVYRTSTINNNIITRDETVVEVATQWSNLLDYWTPLANVRQTAVKQWTRLLHCAVLFRPDELPPLPVVTERGLAVQFDVAYAKHKCRFLFGLTFDLKSIEETHCQRVYETKQNESLEFTLTCETLAEVPCRETTTTADSRCPMDCQPTEVKSRRFFGNRYIDNRYRNELMELSWTFPPQVRPSSVREYRLRLAEATVDGRFAVQTERGVVEHRLPASARYHQLEMPVGVHANFTVQVCAVLAPLAGAQGGLCPDDEVDWRLQPKHWAEYHSEYAQVTLVDPERHTGSAERSAAVNGVVWLLLAGAVFGNTL